MIQRIQTLYLLVIVVLSVFGFFMPMATLLSAESAEVYKLTFKGLLEQTAAANVLVQNIWALSFLMAVSPAIALVSIFLFKNRLLQIRLQIINIIFYAGFYLLLFIYVWQFVQKFQLDWTIHIVTAFPLINIILSVLAIRAIGKDEALVKSLNRLR